MSKLKDLPTEIILKILKNLEIGDLFFWSQVSQRFRAISQNICLWEKVNICDEKIPFGLVKQIVQNGCSYLSVYHCNVFGAKSSLSRSSQLKYLDLSFGNVNLEMLKILLSSCYSLVKLSLANLTLDLEIMEILTSQNGQTLQVLDLAFCKGLALDSDCVKCIVNNCHALTELNLNLTELSEASVKYLTQHLTPTITKLNIGHAKGINSECVESLVSRCNQITALDLQSTPITADAIHAILIHLKLSLEELDVNGPHMDGYFQYIQMIRGKTMLSTMQNLKVFNCASLEGDVVVQLKQQHPGLIINQKNLTIATPELSFNPHFGFWDIEAGKVSYLGPAIGLSEASGNSDTPYDTSMLHIKNMLRLSCLEPDYRPDTYMTDSHLDLMNNKTLHIAISRKHRPSLKRLGRPSTTWIDDLEADFDSNGEEEENLPNM